MTMRKDASLFVLVGGTALLTACIPIPAKHPEQITPTVVGTLSLDDGTPAVQYLIAATDESKDRTCSRPGGRGATDSAGRFQLPATSEEKKVFWFTLMENFGRRSYWVCARRAASGAPGARVDEAARTVVAGHVGGDSLDCLRWHWRDTTRLSCNAAPAYEHMALDLNWKQIIRGGSWTEGAVSGSYRVLLVPIEGWEAEARAAVQWVVDGPAGAQNAVRAQMALPTRDSVALWGASLDHVGDAWRVRVLSIRKTTWGNDIWLTFELGAPGELREIREK